MSSSTLGDSLTTENYLTFDSLDFKVRSEPGDGRRTDSDPGAGKCLHDKDVVFLQANDKDYMWITGGRSTGNNVAITRNIWSSIMKQAQKDIISGLYAFTIQVQVIIETLWHVSLYVLRANGREMRD